MYRPGAQISGFLKPSGVRPYADHGARVVVLHPGRAADVDRADRDHERVVAGAKSTPLGAVRLAVVARRRDDDDAGDTTASIDRLVQRVVVEVALPPPWSEKFATRMLYAALFW